MFCFDLQISPITIDWMNVQPLNMEIRASIMNTLFRGHCIWVSKVIRLITILNRRLQCFTIRNIKCDSCQPKSYRVQIWDGPCTIFSNFNANQHDSYLCDGWKEQTLCSCYVMDETNTHYAYVILLLGSGIQRCEVNSYHPIRSVQNCKTTKK